MTEDGPILYEYVLAPGPGGRYGMLPGGQPPRASIAVCPLTERTTVATEMEERSKLRRDRLAIQKLEHLKWVEEEIWKRHEGKCWVSGRALTHFTYDPETPHIPKLLGSPCPTCTVLQYRKVYYGSREAPKKP